MVTVEATPGEGAIFNGWRDEAGDTIFSASLTTTVNITGDRSIEAVFGVPLFPVTTKVVGNGTVTPTVAAYPLGETAVVTATAAAGWSFVDWSGDIVSTTDPVTFTVDASKVVTATFVEDVVIPDYTLTVNVVGSGTVAPTGGTYAEGTVVQMSATANAGWTFTGWSGDLTDTASSVNVTMDGNKTLTATFTSDSPTQANLTGNFTLQGWSSAANYAVPLTVNLIR